MLFLSLLAACQPPSSAANPAAAPTSPTAPDAVIASEQVPAHAVLVRPPGFDDTGNQSVTVRLDETGNQAFQAAHP